MSGENSSIQWAITSYLVTHGKACIYCASLFDLVAHHKIPREYGGPDELWNLEPVCRRCHPRVENVAKDRASLEGRQRVSAATPRKLVRRLPTTPARRVVRRVAPPAPGGLSEILAAHVRSQLNAKR